jgi:hypothetical protein
MPEGADRPNRPNVTASAAFFFAYLAFQLVYPAMAWFDPAFDKFTWHMYSGLGDELHFTVILEDGSSRETGNLQKTGSAVRLLGPSVDKRRFVPRWLCANWEGARSVVIRDAITSAEDVIRCPSATP